MTQANSAVQSTSQQNQLAKLASNVHKFGGSSLASAECIERVIDIIRQHCQLNDIIVVSANGNTTNTLFALYEQARQNDEQLTASIAALEQTQADLIPSLLNASSAARLKAELAQDIAQIADWLATAAKENLNNVLVFGEVWSARLLSAILSEQVCPSYMIDARDFLVIENEKNCLVKYALSSQKFSHLSQKNTLAIVTGYIASNDEKQTCTLGRNGSDYSATIMAALVGARNVTLWTDVDGIYSADPRVVPLARKLHRLPNAVAKELGRLGNPVLHEKTLQPLTSHSTHLHVASSFAPEISGSEIGSFGQIAKQEISVTHLNDLILAKSVSLIGNSGDAAIKEFMPVCSDVNDGYIVIRQTQQKALSQWLASHDTEVSFTPVAIIAVVGHQVAEQGDMRARFKRALQQSRVIDYVKSSNSHSYIAILSQPCDVELLNSIHGDMTKDARNIGLVVVGAGNIGQRFLEMLPTQLANVAALENVHLVGLVGSSKALINNDGIKVSNAYALYQQQANNYDNTQLVNWLSHHPYDELIVVDITPSEDFSLLYNDFFQQGIHVIGANKWAASSSTPHYQKLIDSAAKHKSLWLGNTTVGAGLPINYAINDLTESGDEISEISGIFSGTLSWLFESYNGDKPFSELLTYALTQGITEPDPREDLSGRDVQRKLLILARAAGFELSLANISCQSLVPEGLQNITTEEFLTRAEELDEYFATRLSDAKQQESCIRYVARFKNATGKISAEVSLEMLSKDDAFASITAGDNIFKIKSAWYHENPLFIRGPGAGRDVTAGGLHSDLVTICKQLVNRKHQVKIKGLTP
jgi:aspartokinase/homoserine dehydrogenase 2